MEDFERKSIEEANQLQDKLIILDQFTYSPEYNELDIIMKKLLKIQVASMDNYLNCLRGRMDLLGITYPSLDGT